MTTQEQSIRTNARWAGIFFILVSAAPISTAFFIGFLGGGITGEPAPDYMERLVANDTYAVIGMLIELIWALGVVGIVVTLLPTLKMYNVAMALGFSCLRFMEAISTVIHSIIGLSLLTLSREYAAAGFPADAYFQNTGALLLAARDWAFVIGAGLVWTLSALLLNYLLYRSRLVPRWLSIWGLAGAVLSLVNYLAQMFGIHLTEIMFAPIGIQEMVFAVWLIVKGFNSSAIAALSTGTDAEQG